MTTMPPRVIRSAKAAAVAEITKKFSAAKSIFLTDYSGLSVEAMTRLRQNMRKAQVEYLVVKNTLARISARQAGCEVIVPHLDGPTAVALGMRDPVAPAKIIADFLKDNQEKPAIKACLVEGQLFEGAMALALARLPSREELLLQLVQAMNWPLRGMAQALSGVLRNFAYVLNAILEEKRQQQAPPASP